MGFGNMSDEMCKSLKSRWQFVLVEVTVFIFQVYSAHYSKEFEFEFV